MEGRVPDGPVIGAGGKADEIGALSTERIPFNTGKWFEVRDRQRGFTIILEGDATLDIDVGPVPASFGATLDLFSVDKATLATSLIATGVREPTGLADEEIGYTPPERMSLTANLAAGRYAIVVTPTAGTGEALELTLRAGCSGAGCGAVRRCAFGEYSGGVYGFGNRIDEVRDRLTLAELTDLERQQAQAIIDTAQYPNVQSVDAVVANARNGIRFFEITTTLGEHYTSVTADLPETRPAYRPTDGTTQHTTFGAFFRAGTNERVALVREGENYACQVEMRFDPLPGCAEAAQRAEDLMLEGLGDARVLTSYLSGQNGLKQEHEFFVQRGNGRGAYRQTHRVETVFEDGICRAYTAYAAASTYPRERDPEIAGPVSPECGILLMETVAALDAQNGWSGDIDPYAIEIVNASSLNSVARVAVSRSTPQAGPAAYYVGLVDGCRVGAIGVEGYAPL